MMSARSGDRSSYRPDVDGLRAVAVLSVLAFHAFPSAVPGGFIGVDIFFVISGFLISRIILGQLKLGTFTFTEFYSRRIRRIFPALTLVLLATLVFGWLALLPADFRQVGLHASAGAGFASNLLLWYQTGDYFDTAAELKPLLHLWSLGVEEQYYLLWPLLLFLLRGDNRHRILWLIIGLAVASFAISVYLVDRKPSAAFYLPQSRFWELMLGSVIAYAHVHSSALRTAWRPAGGDAVALLRNGASAAGIALIAAGLVLLNENRSFPGWWALLPTVGAALLISAGPDTWLNRHVLAARGCVFVGLISYPLYLWHWPLLTYARILNGGESPSAAVRVGALIAAGFLAWATYELVEKRVRHLKPVAWPHGVVAALASGIAAVAVYGALAFGNYAQSRSAHVRYLPQISEAFDDWGYRGDRVIPGDTERSVLFIGDSHMQQFLPRVVRLMQERTAPVRTVIFQTEGGCVPIPGIERRGHECNRAIGTALEVARRPDVEIVIVGASWMGFLARNDQYKIGDERRTVIDFRGPDLDSALHDLETMLAELASAGKRVYLVLSSPRGERFDPRRMAERVGLGFEVHVSAPVPRHEIVASSAHIDNLLKQVAARAGVGLIDPVDEICDAVSCPAVDADGRPLYKDDSHLRPAFAQARFTAFDRYVYDGPLETSSTARVVP
jgi:peptidoglycan/LPS O-acetylase OafA/YrhL